MRLRTSDIKEIARDSLKGHWFSAIIAALVTAFFGGFFMSPLVWSGFLLLMAGGIRYMESVPNYILLILGIGSGVVLFQFFFGETLRLGYIRYNLSLLDRDGIQLRKLFGCFSLFWKALFLRVFLAFLEFCCCILFFLPGIYVYFTYVMSPYVLEEKPKFSVTDAMRASRKMMQGNKLRLFRLKLSFLGWDLLCILTLGLACFYVIPLKNTAEAVFYNEISGRAEVFYAREESSDDNNLS